MRISFRDASLTVTQHRSKHDLKSFLALRGQPSVMIGESPERDVEFYSILVTPEIASSFSERVIGVCAEGHGVIPQLFLLPGQEMLIVGVDQSVFGISLRAHPANLFMIRLDSLFRSFIHDKVCDILLVFHEIGVNAIGTNGQQFWNFSRDILADVTVRGNELTLDFMDSDRVTLDIRTGLALATD